MDYKNYYDILGVDKDADQSEIKKAYRKKARKYHPDVNQDDERAQEKFQEVQEAYEVLSDPEKRQRYDSLGANWKQYARAGGGQQGPKQGFGGGGGPGGFNVHWEDASGQSGFSDFFGQIFSDFYSGSGGGGRGGINMEDLFGQQAAGGRGRRTGRGRGRQRGRRQQRQQSGQDVESVIEVSLEEAFHGTSRDLRMEYPKVCTKCGRQPDPSCSDCGGQGVVHDQKTISVKVPRGVKEGSKIRLQGQGGYGTGGGKRGDLYLKVRIREHPIFDREEEDLYCEVPISPLEAVEGGEISIPGIDESASMKLPSNTESGQQFRLGDLGMPKLNGGDRGDLYVTVRIQLPSSLTDEQKEALQAFSEYDPRKEKGYL